MLRSFILSLCILSAVCPVTISQTSSPRWPPKGWPLPVAKESVVTLKVPLEALGERRPQQQVPVEMIDGVIAVNGIKDWKSAGFPSMAQVELLNLQVFDDPLSTEKKKPKVVGVAVIGDKGHHFYLTWFLFRSSVGDVGAAFRELFILSAAASPEAKTYQQAYFDEVSAKWFTGPLAQLSQGSRTGLLQLAALTGGSVGTQTFKDKQYLVIDVGASMAIYNELRLNKAARAAAYFNEFLIKVLKDANAFSKELPDVYGVLVKARVQHKDLRYEYASPTADALEIYTPFELIRQFTDADITSQQLVDGSVVLSDGDRVQLAVNQQ